MSLGFEAERYFKEPNYIEGTNKTTKKVEESKKEVNRKEHESLNLEPFSSDNTNIQIQTKEPKNAITKPQVIFPDKTPNKTENNKEIVDTAEDKLEEIAKKLDSNDPVDSEDFEDPDILAVLSLVAKVQDENIKALLNALEESLKRAQQMLEEQKRYIREVEIPRKKSEETIINDKLTLAKALKEHMDLILRQMEEIKKKIQ